MLNIFHYLNIRYLLYQVLSHNIQKYTKWHYIKIINYLNKDKYCVVFKWELNNHGYSNNN